jgi:hypothetical protein
MNTTPLAIPDVILLEPKVFRDDQVSSLKASTRGHVTLLATMSLNTNAASPGTIRPSLFNGPLLSAKDRQGNSLAQRGISHNPYQSLPTHHLLGNQLPRRPSHVPRGIKQKLRKECGSIRSRVMFRGDHKAYVEYSSVRLKF